MPVSRFHSSTSHPHYKHWRENIPEPGQSSISDKTQTAFQGRYRFLARPVSAWQSLICACWLSFLPEMPVPSGWRSCLSRRSRRMLRFRPYHAFPHCTLYPVNHDWLYQNGCRHHQHANATWMSLYRNSMDRYFSHVRRFRHWILHYS